MIHNIINERILNPFNPTYSFYLYEDNIQSSLKLDFLKQFILNFEKDCLKKYQSDSDAGTGLGLDSLTSRYKHYNLLKIKETSYLKDIIRQSYDNFLNQLNLNCDEKIYVQCWANVLRKGQKINAHRHDSNNYGYLGGHICVSTNNTSTNYVLPYYEKPYPLKNKNGVITLFPSWMEHYTDEVVNNEERITIAFDIKTKATWDNTITDNDINHYEII
tara:strand:+ start:52 stop:702 length:651 start_codon:yes stop_codon:yes gene_type:complete